MQLTRRALLLLLSTVIPLALRAWMPLAGWLTLLWLIVLLALFIADWRLSAKPKDWELVRRHDDRLSLAIENPVQIDIRLRRGLRTVPIWLRDEPPVTFGVSGEGRKGDGEMGGTGDGGANDSALRTPHSAIYTPADDTYCWMCNGDVVKRHCKIICQSCGFTRDCSDP